MAHFTDIPPSILNTRKGAVRAGNARSPASTWPTPMNLKGHLSSRRGCLCTLRSASRTLAIRQTSPLGCAQPTLPLPRVGRGLLAPATSSREPTLTQGACLAQSVPASAWPLSGRGTGGRRPVWSYMATLLGHTSRTVRLEKATYTNKSRYLNRHHSIARQSSSTKARGPYFLSIACVLRYFAFFAYLDESSRSRDAFAPTASKRSPRPSTSVRFCVMIFVMSLRSSLILLRFRVVRVSTYNRFVFWMNVSNLMKA
mmetsp:Transcript_21173/g.45434  ORF Transcript_21173/g.45434 Transcript_21173/m.45434 type:complete len:256 (-) Transcript_21173:424-1191(-)